MASSSRKQPLNGISNLTNAPPRRQILESLHSGAPSEELRERRRRCFIASSFSKHSPDKRLVLDDSKTKRLILAMREDEEIDFFQSLWNSLAAGRVGEDAATRPTSPEAPVLMEPCNVQDNSAASKQTSAEVARCEGVEPPSEDVNVNSVFRGHSRWALDDGHALNGLQSMSSSIQEGEGVNAENMNLVKRSEDIDASIIDSNGLKNDNGSTGESAAETKVLPDIGAKKFFDNYLSDSNASRIHSSKQNCRISDSVESRCVGNTIVGVSGVPKHPFETEIIVDDERPQGRVYVPICPTKNSVLSQTDQCHENNQFPERMVNTVSYIDNVSQRNVFTQTSSKPHYNVRSNRGQSLEAKGKPQRNWYRHNENMNDRPGDRDVYPHQRSHSCHIEQPRRFHQPNAPCATQRYKSVRGKELTQNKSCSDRRSNLRPSRNQQVHTPNVADEMANVGCKYRSNSSSSFSSVSNASTREKCSCLSNHETSFRRPYEKKARNIISKINFKSRRSFNMEIPFRRTSTSQEKWSTSCCCSDDVITSHGGRKMADDDADGDAFAPPRHILLCSICDVVVNSKKKMWAHLKGARHSRTAQGADRRCQHGAGEGENPNRVVCCSTKHRFNNMLTCRMSYIEPPTLVPVLQYALVEKRM